MTKFELKQMIMEALNERKSKKEPVKPTEEPFKKKLEPKKEPVKPTEEPDKKPTENKPKSKLPKKEPKEKNPTPSDNKHKIINLQNVNVYELIKNLEAGPKNKNAYKIYKLIKIAVSLGKPNANIPADIIAKRRNHITSPLFDVNTDIEETE